MLEYLHRKIREGGEVGSVGSVIVSAILAARFSVHCVYCDAVTQRPSLDIVYVKPTFHQMHFLIVKYRSWGVAQSGK